MKEVVVNGFVIRPFDTRGDGNGRMSYSIMGVSKEFRGSVTFPSTRIMKRLAREYLKCEYVPEEQLSAPHWFHFTIDAGVSYERRVAFLAAVMTRAVPKTKI